MSPICNDDAYDYLFKVVVIGDCSVGKTCVVQRFKAGTYVERHGNTIGVDFAMKEVTVDNKRIKVSMKCSEYVWFTHMPNNYFYSRLFWSATYF